jgi:hypothetical protein
MAIISPKKAIRQLNNTLSGSMKTPAAMPPGIHGAVRLTKLSTPEETAGIRVKAKKAVTAPINKTNRFRALALKRAINGTKTLETSGRIQTSQDETSENCNYASASVFSSSSGSTFIILPMSLVPYFFVTITSRAKMTALTQVSVEKAKIRNASPTPLLAGEASITKLRVAAVATSSIEMNTFSK